VFITAVPNTKEFALFAGTPQFVLFTVYLEAEEEEDKEEEEEDFRAILHDSRVLFASHEPLNFLPMRTPATRVSGDVGKC
jgi:hypothetical protein